VSALPWIIGGAAVGVGFLYLRSKQAAKDTKPPSTCDGISAIGDKLGVPIPKGLCEGLGGIVEGIGAAIGTTEAEVKRWDADNAVKNGAVTVPISKLVRNMSYTNIGGTTVAAGGAGGLATRTPALRGTALEFKNGCTPFEGSSGWSKCAPGTHDMLVDAARSDLNGYPVMRGPRTNVKTSPAYIMSGSKDTKKLDVTTGGPFKPGADGNSSSFPIPIPAGHLGWIYRGRAFTCPEPVDPDWTIRDHRAGVEVPVCVGAFGGSGLPPPPVGGGDTGPGRTGGGVVVNITADVPRGERR